MKIEIKNRWSNAVLFTCDVPSNVAAGMEMRHALEKAVASGADLGSADLGGANLGGADLGGADLGSANLRGAKNSELAVAMTRVPAEGSIIGWKKCLNGVIVKLRIPEDAKRSNAWSRKCRAEFADVLEVIGADVAVSSYNRDFTYTKGQRVKPANNWCDDYTQECAGGIHFFITRAEAEAYVL